jgi:hypothetical protein
MPTLTKEQIEILESGGWMIESMEPFKMSFDEQFCGSMICTSIEEALEEIENIKAARDFKEWLKNKSFADMEKDVRAMKDSVKDLLVTGITVDTLLNFFIKNEELLKYGDTFIAENMQELYQEAFDEVSPR